MTVAFAFAQIPFTVASSPKVRNTEEMNSYLIKTTTAKPRVVMLWPYNLTGEY